MTKSIVHELIVHSPHPPDIPAAYHISYVPATLSEINRLFYPSPTVQSLLFVRQETGAAI